MPDSDDFDRQLRDLTSGQAEPAKFQELSAAERARRAATPPPSPSKLNWRKSRKARKLRRPLSESGKKPGPPQAKRKTPSMASRTPAARRKQRFLQIARTVGILIAFAALLYGLHLLGFGPQ
ncbi:MAG TPA: hypothetical protein VF979_10100 [Streptosporangiaceae bacterium]